MNIVAYDFETLADRLNVAGFTQPTQMGFGRSLDEVSFLELSEAVDGPQQVAPCNGEIECDRRPYCTVAGPVADLGMQITGLLSGISVGQLLRGELVDHRKGAAV